MPYGQFTLTQVKKAFDLTTIEGGRFLPDTPSISPSQWLTHFLEESLPNAASGSEKARSEGIIYPVLIEVRRILNRKITVFSGEDFTVDESIGLNGVCDFLITRSIETLAIESPIIAIVEAKKGELKPGIGQCIAEMVAAQRFNQASDRGIEQIYGVVTSGTQWRFLKLEGSVVTIDLTDYPLPPVDWVLGMLVYMASKE
jgi:hypothetical protein